MGNDNQWASRRDAYGAEHDTAASENVAIVTGILVIVSVLVVIAAAFTMYRALAYPVIWRYYMFMNAPHSLVLVSVLIAGVIIFALNRGGARKARLGTVRGEGYTTCLLLGLPMILGFTQLGLFINGAADKSRPEAFDTVVLDKRISRSSKSPPQWHVHVADWRHQGQTVRITVSEYQYDQLAPGSVMRVATKRGFLGYEWLVSHS